MENFFIGFIRFIGRVFWPPSEFNLSIPRFIAKVSFIPPELTYDFILYDKYRNKWTIILKEFDKIYFRRIDNKIIWDRYTRILQKGQFRGLIDAFYSYTERGNRIACLFIRPPNTRKKPKYTIVYSHGNGVDLGMNTGFIWRLSKNTKCNVFAYDYSGYGLSSGKPSEMNIYYDIVSAVNSLISRYNIEPQKVILYGESIGSAPTVDLSSRENFAGVVLHAALMSGIRVFYFYSSRTWLFDPFPNIEKVHSIECPVLVIHGMKDDIISIKHGFALYKQCKYTVKPLWVKDAFHNDIRLKKEYYPRVRKFIRKELKKPKSEWLKSIDEKLYDLSFNPIHNN